MRAVIAVIVTTILLALVVLAAAGPVRSAPAGVADELLSRSLSIPLARGVSFERRNALTAAGWVGLSIIRIDLTCPYVAVGPALAGGVLTSPAKATEIAETAGLVAAINGDFFDAGVTGAPLSLLVADGRMVRSPRNDRDFASLAILGDMGILGSWTWSGQLIGPGGLTIPISAVNEVSVPADGAVLYTGEWSWQRRPPSSGVTCLAIRGGIVESRTDGWPRPASVPMSEPTDPDSERAGLVYLAARGSAATLAASLSDGDSVEISGQLSPDAEGIVAAFSGKPVLLRDGIAPPDLWRHTGIQSLFAAPRTAAGLTQDGQTLLLVVADGRQAAARGLTLSEFAALMQSLGAWNALNLDGGGSSSAVIRDPFSKDTVLLANRPSGASQRPVPYVVGVQSVLPDADRDAGSRLATDGETDADIAFLSISIDVPGDPAHLGDRPSIAAALQGGPAHLVEEDLHVEAGTQILLSARLYNSAMQVIDPGVLDTVEVKWNVMPPKSLRGRDLASLDPEVWTIAHDTLTAALSPQSPGRFEIEATAIWTKSHPSGELAMERSNTVSFAVRAVEPMPIPAPPPEPDPRLAFEPILIEGFDNADEPGWAGWVSSSSSPDVKHSLSFSAPPTGEPDSGLDTGPHLTIPGLPSPAPSGQVAMLNYDLGSSEATRAVYLRPSEPILLPEGTGIISMWVWGDGCGHWLRATVADGAGTKSPIDFPRIHWTGWRYVQASLPAQLMGPAWLTQVYLVEFKPEMQGAGTVYIDSIAAVGLTTPDDPAAAESSAATPALAPATATVTVTATEPVAAAPPASAAVVPALPAISPYARAKAPEAPKPKPLEPGESLANLVRPTLGRHVVTIDGSRGSIPWRQLVEEFDSFAAGSDVELVVVLKGATAIDPTTLAPGGTLKDSLQAQLLMDLLNTLADGSTSVILVQDSQPDSLRGQSGLSAPSAPVAGALPEPVWTMLGQVRVVWK